MTQQGGGYHHGDLRRALVTAGLELARADGSNAVVLREVTRRSGVSPAAAYRHFADRESLVAAVAQAAVVRLAAALERAADAEITGPARLAAIGKAYIQFALNEPGLFDVAMFSQSHMFSHQAIRENVDQAPAYLQLVRAIDQLVTEGLIPAETFQAVATMCWSSVHGFAALTVKGPLRGVPRAHVDSQASQLVDQLVQAVTDGSAGFNRPALEKKGEQ